MDQGVVAKIIRSCCGVFRNGLGTHQPNFAAVIIRDNESMIIDPMD